MKRTHNMRRSRGNAAMFAALMMVPMGMLAGLGIDFGRAYVAQSRLSQSVDAAALAGGRKLSVVDPTSDARMYFNSNFNAANEASSSTSS